MEIDLTELALKKLGTKISELRINQKLTKVQLAFEINTSESNLRRIEKGSVNVGFKTLFSISQALDVEIKELFDF